MQKKNLERWKLIFVCILVQAKTVAEQLAAKLNTKLNYQPKEEDDKSEEEQVETFRKYEEELEINDFPQQARWRVTSKVILMRKYRYLENRMTFSYKLWRDPWKDC